MKLDTLDAFKGLQIRTMENSNHMAFWTAIGAAPTPLAWLRCSFPFRTAPSTPGERSGYLRQHQLSGGPEVPELHQHILYLNQIIINNDKFNSLDPLYQDALTQAVEEAIARAASRSDRAG